MMRAEMGRDADAERMFKRSLTIREKALGPDHPRVAKVLESYAGLLRRAGRGSEADALVRRAHEIKAKSGASPP